jgi:hypothetical protein
MNPGGASADVNALTVILTNGCTDLRQMLRAGCYPAANPARQPHGRVGRSWQVLAAQLLATVDGRSRTEPKFRVWQERSVATVFPPMKGRCMTVESGSLLASGNVADVFAWGNDRVLKLYKPVLWAKRVAFREAANQAAVEGMGLPVPALHGVVAQSERWGIVSDRVNGTSFAQRMLANPTLVTGHLEALIDLQLRLQQTTAPFFAGVKQRLANHISRAPQLTPERKDALISGLHAMPDGDQLCHFDFHPMNVLGGVNSPAVIDWCDACRGTALADACRSHVLLEIHTEMLAALYLEHFCRMSQCSADELLAWRPYMLAAKLIETPVESPRLLSLLAATGW